MCKKVSRVFSISLDKQSKLNRPQDCLAVDSPDVEPKQLLDRKRTTI